MRKNLIAISAPSGAGKTTICRELQHRRPQWQFSVSCTTRPKRRYERDGIDYHFVSEEEFSHHVESGKFVEYEEVHGYLYGTLRSAVQEAVRKDQTLLLEVDVKGGINIKDAFPENTITIFVRPPSLKELERRLRERGADSEARIAKRLERMELEMAYENQYDFSVINEDLDTAVSNILAILEHDNKGECYGN